MRKTGCCCYYCMKLSSLCLIKRKPICGNSGVSYRFPELWFGASIEIKCQANRSKASQECSMFKNTQCDAKIYLIRLSRYVKPTYIHNHILFMDHIIQICEPFSYHIS